MTDMVSRKEYERVIEENKQLKEQIDYLMRKTFGKSSEQTDLTQAGQTSLFEEESSVFTEPEKTGEQTETLTYTRKKKRATRQEKIAPEIPVKEIVYNIDHGHCNNCQRELQSIGKSFVREQVRFIPAKLYKERIFQTTYKCSYCESHQEEYANSPIVKAAVPNPILAHSLATPSLIAQVAHSKYELYLPVYRQLREFKMAGLTLSEPTLINWLNKAAEWLNPMVQYLKEELLDQPYIHGDETTCQVLREEDKKPTSKSYIWLVCSAEQADKQVVYFEYAASRGKEVVQKIYHGYHGNLTCDGYSSYNYLDSTATRSGCWAHVRRKFYEASEGVASGRGLSMKGKNKIDTIFSAFYHPERPIVEPIKNLVENFFKWVHQNEIMTKSKLGKAMTYVMNQEPYLCRFLKDTQIALDNNIAERHIKQAVMGRKNWLFSTSVKGANTNTIFLSIVETAKANGLKAHKYIEYLLEKIPQLPQFPTKEQLAAYLPWSQQIQAICK